MNEDTQEKWFKAGIASVLILMLSFSVAGANNQTIEFEAFDGTVDSNGDLVTGDTNIDDYSAVVYDFETDSFDDAESFYTRKDTASSNMTIHFNISDTEERNYGIYFYKRDSNGDDEYITYEYTVTLNKTGQNIDAINNTNYGDSIYFTRKTGAESNIRIDQFDELVAGDPVTVGVDIEVDAPIDQAYVTSYTPNNEFGQVNLTDFYRTDVQYTLEAINLSDGSGTTVDSLTDTVSLEFGGSKYLEFTTIDQTGEYNITGETDPTVDAKVQSGTISSDYEEVQYLSKIKTIISSASSEYSTSYADVEINLEDNLEANEADIAKYIEYSWLNSLDVTQSLLDAVRGAQGLDAVDLADRTNQSILDSGDLPYSQTQYDNGDWYICHRAWVEDDRSLVTKGETSCRHFMVDDTPPSYTNMNAPTGEVTYREDGFDFNITVSDNIELNEVNFTIDGRTEESYSSLDATGANDLTFNKNLNARATNYTYTWKAWDRVMSESGLAAEEKTVLDLKVNPLPTNPTIELEDGSGNAITSPIYWNDSVTVNVTTTTEMAPLSFSSNFTGWSFPADGAEQGSYSEQVYLNDVGVFSFGTTAGDDNNYVEETDSAAVEVQDIPTNANITLIDTDGNEISSAGLMENVTVRADPTADQKNDKAPTNVKSNISLSEWDNVSSNGFYEQEIQMKESGTFYFNLSTGDAGQNSEGFQSSNDSATLTVDSSNGDEDLNWNKTVQDQEVFEGEAFSYDLEANYSGTVSDLVWNILEDDNFSISTGSENSLATVTNKSDLSEGVYEINVEVYDNRGSYLSEKFSLTVNPALYWASEPSDQSIDEGQRYSQDLLGNVEYIDDKSNLTWNITENRDLFTVNDGLVEDTEELSAGNYEIGLNVSDEDGRKINTSYTLTVNSVSSSGGGDDDTSTSSFTTTSFSSPEPEKNLSIGLSSSNVAVGQSVDVSGTLGNAQGSENVTVTVGNRTIGQVQVSDRGDYSLSFTAQETGNKTVEATSGDLSATAGLEVFSGLEISSVSSPEVIRVNNTFSVCTDIESDVEPRVELFENGESIENRRGEDVCFRRTLSEVGNYEYLLEASVPGQTVERTFTVDVRELTTLTADSDSAEDDEAGSTAGQRITGAFTSAVSGTSGKVGLSILTGLILTAAIIFGL